MVDAICHGVRTVNTSHDPYQLVNAIANRWSPIADACCPDLPTCSSTDRTVRTARKTIHDPTKPYGPYELWNGFNTDRTKRTVRENDFWYM